MKATNRIFLHAGSVLLSYATMAIFSTLYTMNVPACGVNFLIVASFLRIVQKMCQLIVAILEACEEAQE